MAKIITLITKFILAIIAAFFFASCGGYSYNYKNIKGDGISIEETRDLNKNFDEIHASNGIQVIVEQAANTSVKVEADSNLMKHIITEIEGNTLRISSDTNFNSELVRVIVKLPKLKALSASSASKINSSTVFKSNQFDIETSSAARIDANIEADAIQISASSASRVTVVGKALNLITDASSAAKIEANDLWVNDVEADASSGASITVHPIVKLNAEASSGASIEYAVKPTDELKINTSSGGSVHQK